MVITCNDKQLFFEVKNYAWWKILQKQETIQIFLEISEDVAGNISDWYSNTYDL